MNEYMDLCILNELFTCGDSRQYTYCILMFVQLKSGRVASISLFERLVSMTYICSDIDKWEYDDIYSMIRDLFDKVGILITA